MQIEIYRVRGKISTRASHNSDAHEACESGTIIYGATVIWCRPFLKRFTAFLWHNWTLRLKNRLEHVTIKNVFDEKIKKEDCTCSTISSRNFVSSFAFQPSSERLLFRFFLQRLCGEIFVGKCCVSNYKARGEFLVRDYSSSIGTHWLNRKPYLFWKRTNNKQIWFLQWPTHKIRHNKVHLFLFHSN